MTCYFYQIFSSAVFSSDDPWMHEEDPFTKKESEGVTEPPKGNLLGAPNQNIKFLHTNYIHITLNV